MSELDKFRSEVSRHRQSSTTETSEEPMEEETDQPDVERDNYWTRTVDAWRKYSNTTNGPVLRAIAKVLRVLACLVPIIFIVFGTGRLILDAVQGEETMSSSAFIKGVGANVLSAIILFAVAEALTLFVNIADDTRALKNRKTKQD